MMFQKEFNPNLTDFQIKSIFPLEELRNENIVDGMVLQMIETQTLTTFLFVDTDENGELSLQDLFVFIKSEY